MYANSHPIYTGSSQTVRPIRQATSVDKPRNPSKPINEAPFILKAY
jgi:hypothetical protein